MTIVANDSITVSNVNDGSITHTAWSYSADGTDRFTTVYLNLNLLDGTKDFSGTWSSSGKWVNDGTYQGLTVKKKTGIWFPISKMFTAPKDGVYTFSAFVKSSGNLANVKRYTDKNGASYWDGGAHRIFENNFDWLRDNFTVTLKTGDTILVRYEITGTGTDSILWTAGHKWEEGSTATPWMPSASEVTTADWPKYIGHYMDFMQADSTNPSDYTWGPMRGDDGKPGADGKDGVAGKDGNGIKTTAITYQASTNGTTAPNGTWSASVPNVAKGSFLWTRTIWTYTDNTTETGYAVAYMGTNGNNGTNGLAGKDGTSIKTTTITYVGSTNGTTAPTSGWTSTVPTVAAGSYLWTKTVWAYTDNTSETGYSVAKMGNNGEAGPQGPQGLKGDPGATGIPGQAGADGKTSYLHIAYATNSTGTAGFDVSNSTGKTYIGQYTDFTSDDSTDPSKYTWSLIKGDKGDKGDPGIKGSDGTSGIIVSSVAPDIPQNGQLWQDTSTTPQLVKKWTGASWVIWEFYAQNLKADSLETVSAKIGKIYNEFEYEATGSLNKGSITIENDIQFTTENLTNINHPKTNIALSSNTNFTGLQVQYLPNNVVSGGHQTGYYTSNGMYMQDNINGWYGNITAENVTLVPWTNLTYLSGFTTAENNPCQYRKIKNLDGSYTVQFRGQVKPVSGNFAINTQYNTIRVPVDAQPATNKFGLGIGDFTGAQSARLVSFINDGANKGTIQVRVTGTASAYIAIDNLTYIL